MKSKLLMAFAVGFVPMICMAMGLGMAMTVLAEAWGLPETQLGVGPIGLVAYELTALGQKTSVGVGVPILAVAAGLANVAGAVAFGRRADNDPQIERRTTPNNLSNKERR